MMLGYVLVAIVAAAVAVFALQNAAPTPVRFLVWSADGVPVAGLVLASLAVGIVVTSVSFWLERWRLLAKIRALESRLTAIERERATSPRPAEPPGHRALS
jgi:uncharacterized integral membrane protein